MSLLTAAIIDAVSTDADALRRVYKLLSGGQQGIGVIEGDLKVTTSGGMVSVIAAGDALINGTQNTVTQGSYGIKNDANISQTHSAADPTNPRNDLVGIKIEDAFYAGVNKQATAVIVTGTPAPSPVDPTAPANWLPLARVRVNAGAGTLGTITDLRPRIGLPFHAEVYRSAAFSVANGFAWTRIPYDTLDLSGDPNSNMNLTTGVYTCALAGRHRVSAHVQLSGVATAGFLGLSISLNGANDSRRIADGQGGSNQAANGSAIIRCAAADTLAVQIAQNTGSNPASLFAGAGFCWAQFEYVGP